MEIQCLQNSFKHYKKEGERVLDQPKTSSEVFIYNNSSDVYSHYVRPLDQLETRPGTEQSEMAKEERRSMHLENLIKDEFIINRVYDHVKAKMKSNALELDCFLEETNQQINSSSMSAEDLMIKKAINEVNQDLQIGYETAESHLKELGMQNQEGGLSSKNEKYFMICRQSQDEARKYKDMISKQIYILYSLYLQRQKLSEESKKDFFDYISKFLQLPKPAAEVADSAKNTDGSQAEAKTVDKETEQYLPPLSIYEARIQMGLDAGIQLSINLLRELGKQSPAILVSSLQTLLDSLKQYRPGALYSATDKMSYQLDQNLNAGRDFLVEEIRSQADKKSFVKDFVVVALRLIMTFGIVRSNVEDYLLVISLLELDYGFSVDLSEEIKTVSSFYDTKPEMSKEDSGLSNYKIGKLNLLTSISIQMLACSGSVLELRQSQGDQMVQDDKFFYIYKYRPGTTGYNSGIYKLSTASENNQGAAQRLTGKVLQWNTDEVFTRLSSETDSFMVIYEGRLFVKYSPRKEKPQEKESKEKKIEEDGKEEEDTGTNQTMSSQLLIVDTESLDIEKDKASLEHIPSWRNEWTKYKGKQVNFYEMPVLTEGKNLYVFGRERVKDVQNQSNGAEASQASTTSIQIFVNVYEIENTNSSSQVQALKLKQIQSSAPDAVDGRLPTFKYVRQFTLLKKENKPFSKDSNNLTISKQLYWATNGPILLCFDNKNKVYWFDTQTGKKISKAKFWSASDVCSNTLLYFNYSNSQFTRMLTRDHSSDVNKYWLFSYSNFKVQNQEVSPQTQLLELRKQMQGKPQISCYQNLNIIKSLMKKPKRQQAGAATEKSLQLSPSSQRCLILDQLNNFITENFDIQFEEIRNKSQSQRIDDILKLFKFENCTYLTESVFLLLAENLNNVKKELSTSPDSMAQQYSLLFLLKLVGVNFRALNHCQIKLSFLLDDELGDSEDKEKALKDISKDPVGYWNKNERGYRYFMHTFESTIVAIVEKGAHKTFLQSIEDQALREELTQLWNQIKAECKSIIDGSISLLHQDPSSMVEILHAAISKPKEELSYQNLCVQISYLNLKDNQKKIVDHPLMWDLVKKLSLLYSEMVIKNMERDKQSSLENLLEHTVQAILLNYSQLILQKYCETQEHLVSQARKQKEQGEQLNLQNKYLKPLIELTDMTLAYLEKHLLIMLEKNGGWDFQANILRNMNIFFENTLVLVQMFALLKMDSFEQDSVIVQLCNKFMALATCCSKFQSKEQDGEKLYHVSPQFMMVIDGIYRQICWLLGQTAFRMIKVQKMAEDASESKTKEKISDQQKKNLANIQESNLLAGGIETRHLSSVLSKERQDVIKTYLMIIDDKYLQQHFESQEEHFDQDDDRILKAIIQEGQDESTDILIRCLQRSLETSIPMIPYARLMGNNGLRMSRAAFALLIKFSDMLEDFVSLVDQIQFLKEVESSGPSVSPTNINPALEFLKGIPHFADIKEKWKEASKMRSWISESKSRISVKYDKEVKDEVLKKRKTAKAQDQIDSSSQPKSSSTEKKKQFSPEEDQYIENEAFDRTEKELLQIIDKIQHKAEFLIKLQIPLQFLNQTNYKPASDDSPTKKKSANVQSCVQCVLSILQAPVQFGKIQEQVELIYLNACKRVTGLKIISNLINLEAPDFILYDNLNWFCAALRGNQNKITHYMDDIKGEGTYLENKTRMYFFEILSVIVKKLRDSKDVGQIKFLLKNTLEWKFMGRDHKNLLELNILQVLHKGNGEKDNMLRRCWGKNLLLGKKFSIDEQSISKDVIESFENLLNSIIARIIDVSHESASEKKKKNQLSLQKAKSVINEDVSETLLVQGFDIIFKEFNRYIKIMNKQFKGIDWSTYVKSRTQEAAQVSQDTDFQHNVDLFDQESSQQVKPEKVEARKDESKEDAAKREAEAKQKQRVTQQLSQIDRIYQETFLRRLIRIVEVFTSVHSRKAVKQDQESLGSYHINLLVKLTNSENLATLLNLLVLASPPMKFTILQILQQLISVQQISHSVFDKAVEIAVQRSEDGQSTEAESILKQVRTQIAEFKSPFLQFMYHYLFSIRSKMWSKSNLESEGSYAISGEVIRTIRFIYEHNHDSKCSNYAWREEIDQLFAKVFQNFGKFKSSYPIELEIVLSLIRGCDFRGMMQYAPGYLVEHQSEDEVRQEQKASKKDSRKFVKVLGFVTKKWMQRQLDWQEDLKRVYPILKDTNNQKVLVMQYDQTNLAETSLQIYEPQNINLLYDLNEIQYAQAHGQSVTVEQEETQDSTQAPAPKKQLQITSAILNTLLKESQIFESDSQVSDINDLSQRTMVMKLIHYQLENNTEEFLDSLKQSDYYKQLLRYVCQESSSSEKGASNNITLIDWLEQRCAAIRQNACENQSSLIKLPEVKISLVKDKLFVHTLNPHSAEKNDFYMTAIQLISAINYATFEEKKEFRLVLEDDVSIEKQDDGKESQGSETNDVALVRPEALATSASKGYDILNQSKSMITYGMDFNQLVANILELQAQNPDRYLNLAQKTVFMIEKQEFEQITEIMLSADKGPKREAQAAKQPNVFGGTPFEESLIEELINYGGFSRVLAEKIISKEKSLEKKTLNFTKILKQIKDGLISIEELEEQRQAEVDKQSQDKSKVLQKKKRSKGKTIEQKTCFDRPEEKIEVVNKLKINFSNFLNKCDSDISIEAFNDRHAYFEKVNVFQENEGLSQEYEKIMKRLFNMYCRQIFWSLIQNDDIEKIFELILNSASMSSSMRSFCIFIKVIGNECFITNNKKYIESFKEFLGKVVKTCCKKDSHYKQLIGALMQEAIIQSYHDYFSDLLGTSHEFRKHIFEYFQSESNAEHLMNPIVLQEVIDLVIENDISLIFENGVEIISLLAAVSMLFQGNYELKGKFLDQMLRILEIFRQDWQSPEQPKRISLDRISKLVNLKVVQAYLQDYDSYASSSMEEALQARNVLRDDPSKEINQMNRKLTERHVYLYRNQLHQDFIKCDIKRWDNQRQVNELAFKLRQLAEIEGVEVYFGFQNNLMSYFDLYERVLNLSRQKEAQNSSFIKYLTFYNSLEDQKKIYTHEVAIKNPAEGCHIQSLEVDFGKDPDQLVEKVLVHLDNNETQFNSQGAIVLTTQDRDGKYPISIFNKTLFEKDQTLQNVYSKGKSFFVHYPVFPNYNYMMFVHTDEPKLTLMEKQLFEQFDNFTSNDFGTFYLGGDHSHLHYLNRETLKPYKNHLDIKRVNFGKGSMIFLLKTGQVYGMGYNKSRHFADQEQGKPFDNEQLVPFHDTKDKIETIETYKRNTVAITSKGRIYAVGDKLKKLLKIQGDRFGFYPLPLVEQAEEEGKEEDKEGETQIKEEKKEEGKDETLLAKKVWISRCHKKKNNYIVYCLFLNTETSELELHSIGKNQGGGLLGLGENVQEAMSFKRMELKDGEEVIKIKSVEGVDVRCGRSHTIICVNDYENIFALGCYGKGSSDDILYEPKPLTMTQQYKVVKLDTEDQRTVIVAMKKDTEKMHIMTGQWAPLVKEDNYKNAQFAVDLSGKGPNSVSQVYVRGDSAYISTRGNFQMDPYFKPENDQKDCSFKRGFEAQGLKQSFQKLSDPKVQGKHSGVIVKLTPDYGFFENRDFIKHHQADWDKFEKALSEYKEVLNKAPEEEDKKEEAEQAAKLGIEEFEKMIKDYVVTRLKDDSFVEIDTYWRQIKEKNDIDESRGLKSKQNELINEEISVDCKKYNLGLYTTFCCYIWGSLNYVNRSASAKNVDNYSLLKAFSRSRSNIPQCIVNKLLKQHLGTLETDGDNVSIHVNRRKAHDFMSSGQVDLKGENTIFAQVMKRMQEQNYRGLRINQADKKAWFVKFIGEYAVDDGGLFRESLTEICSELRSKVLPLLIKSQNQEANVGQERDMWILNPDAKSERQLKMMEFLGALMGMSFRSGILLDVSLSRFVWKQVAGIEVTKADLKFVDELFVNSIEDVVAKSKSLSDEEFKQQVGSVYNMNVLLSSGEMVDLIENGGNIPVTKDLAQEYHDKALRARLDESKLQVQALVAGIDKTFDKNFLKMVSWQYLEYKVVGLTEVDIARLKEITSYRNCSETHEVVKRFWQVLDSLSNEDKISYLRFVWGRTRLPLKEQEVADIHTIQLDENADSSRLPIGRTCFFRIELPPYENSQLLKSKLLYSINHCFAIDADYDRAGAPNEEEALPDNIQQNAAAAAAEDSGSPRYHRRRQQDGHLFGDGESYGSSGINDEMGGGGGEEE